MGRLHLSVPVEIEARVRERARAAGVSVSRYLADVVWRELGDDWPPGFFENVVGSFAQEPLVRPSAGALEDREPK